MNNYNVYEDIAKRTNGDIYLGVVGPVRCGKSTFIASFMNSFVLPNIQDKNMLARAKDELPQSGDGKIVMTTQPNFVPNEAVSICVNKNVNLNVRLIDCVGFMVKGAVTSEDENTTRMVKTPWSENLISFESASEIGTKKVINEHSNVLIMLTTDSSFTSIPNFEYALAEEKTMKELQNSGKPFVVVVNSANIDSEECSKKVENLKQKYSVPVLKVNATNLKEENVNEIFTSILNEFGVKSVKINMPMWLRALPYDDELIQNIVHEISSSTLESKKIEELTNVVMFQENDNFEPIQVDKVLLGNGEIYYNVKPKQNLFYKVLSKQCGVKIENDFELISSLKQLSFAKNKYDKIKDALEQVEEEGYGVVNPSFEDILLEEPKVVKQGNKTGVQIKASAPSLHIMKIDVETEINPIIGTQEQSEELANYLSQQYDENPEKMWRINMLGKSLHELVENGVKSKIKNVPKDVKLKLKRTLQRVTNENRGGVICILL